MKEPPLIKATLPFPTRSLLVKRIFVPLVSLAFLCIRSTFPLHAFILEEIYAFPSGSSPRAALLEGPDGAFYGTTYAGGDTGNGGVFRVAKDGVLATLFSFAGTNGANPTDGLLWGK